MKQLQPALVGVLFLILGIEGSALSAQTCSGSGTKLISVKVCTVTHAAEAEAVAVYPNPAPGVFWIKNPGNEMVLEVFDLLGKRVLTQQILAFSLTEIRAENLTAGLYLVRWQSEFKRGTIFLVIGN